VRTTGTVGRPGQAPRTELLVAAAGRRFGGVAQAAGIVSGIGFVGVAVAPWDRVLDAHNTFVQVAPRSSARPGRTPGAATRRRTSSS
jgi:hypothetical protein